VHRKFQLKKFYKLVTYSISAGELTSPKNQGNIMQKNHQVKPGFVSKAMRFFIFLTTAFAMQMLFVSSASANNGWQCSVPPGFAYSEARHDSNCSGGLSFNAFVPYAGAVSCNVPQNYTYTSREVGVTSCYGELVVVPTFRFKIQLPSNNMSACEVPPGFVEVVAFRDTFSNSCQAGIGDGSFKYRIMALNQSCYFNDAGTGATIITAPGSTLSDSRGIAYTVSGTCALGQVPDQCIYTDAGNGKSIAAPRFGVLRDSLGRSYNVGGNCQLF
jgi:hypothetical protein